MASKKYAFTPIKKIMKRNLKKIRKTMKVAKDYEWNNKLIGKQLLQGLLLGESIPKISKRIQNVTGITKRASIREARTMTTSAENKARQDSYEQAEKGGVILKKVWLATSDNRTRDSHDLLNGETVDIDEPFSNGLMYPADPSGDPEEVYNCRCTMITKVEGFRG